MFIDKKVDDLTYNRLCHSVSELKLKVYFTERIIVNWGDYSQIQAEMILFKTAFSRSGYTYYHLISGSDFPLVRQEEIHCFFNRNQGKQFLTIVNIEHVRNKIYERVKFHYKFPHISERSFKFKIVGQLIYRPLRLVEISLYRLLGIDHFSKYNIPISYASQWVSIKEEWIKEVFSHALLCDELFIPIIISKHNLEDMIYYKKGMINSPESFQGNLRYINWWDGGPYTWTDSKSDIEEVKLSKKKGYLFSRKFELTKYPKWREIIKGIINSSYST